MGKRKATRVRKPAGKNRLRTGRDIRVGEVLAETYDVFKKNFLITAKVLVIPYALYVYYMGNLLANGIKAVEKMPSTPGQLAFSLAVGILFGFAYMILMKIYDSGEKTGYFQKAAAYSLSRCLHVIAVMLVYFAATIVLMIPFILLVAFVKVVAVVVIGYILMLVFLIYLGLRFGQAWIIALLKPKVKNSFAESDRICRGRKSAIFFSGLTVFFMMFFFEVILGLLAAILIPKIPQQILYFVIFPVLALAFGVMIQYFAAFYYAMYHKLSKTAP